MSDQDPVSSDSPLEGLNPEELLQRGLESVRQTSGTTPKGWQPPDPEHLSRLLPQYRIESLVGRGGMGAVYRGIQANLERPVAIKLLPAEMAADAEFVARFQREARTLARLNHPGIVMVHEFGQTSEGHLFFVMEFVDGTDLHQIIHGPGLKSEQALEIIAQICDSLQYAHTLGVIHRDIKPANILLTRDGITKLADFGLARPLTEESGLMTRSNIVMGTPDYIAPEAMIGQADHRADLYALGVMLYEMLTGQTPRGAWARPSQRVQVDVRLDDVVIRALQQDPNRRYQQASEMRTDVDIIRTTPPPKVPAKPAAKKPKPAHTEGRRTRHKKSSATTWALSLGALAFIGGGAWLALPEGKPASPAVANSAGSADSREPSSTTHSTSQSKTTSPTATEPVDIDSIFRAPDRASASFPTLGSPPGDVALSPWLTDARETGGKLRVITKVDDATLDLGDAANFSDFVEVHALNSGWFAIRANGDVYGGWGGIKAEPFGPVRYRSLARSHPALALDEQGADHWHYGKEQSSTDLAHPGARHILGVGDKGKIALDEDHKIIAKSAFGDELVPPPDDFFQGAVAFVCSPDQCYYAALPDQPVKAWDAKEGRAFQLPPETTDTVEIESHLVVMLRTRAGRVFVLDKDGDLTTSLYNKPPDDLPPAVRVKAGNFGFGAQLADGTWRVWGTHMAARLFPDLRALGPVIDLDIGSANSKDAMALIIEPPTTPSSPGGESLQWNDLLAELKSGPNANSQIFSFWSEEPGGFRVKRYYAFSLPAEEGPEVTVRLTGTFGPDRGNGKGQGFAIHLREETSGAGYSASLGSSQGGRAQIRKGSETLQSFTLEGKLDLKASHTLEFRAQGDLLTILVDGVELGSARDSAFSAGGKIVVSGSEGDLVEKVEYRYLGEPKIRPTAPLPAVTKDAPFENSLGMKFVSVPGTDILMCIHETRRKDYAAYAEAVPGVDMTWKNPIVQGKPLVQDEDHPVVEVSWEDATDFCAWLGKTEGHAYRLPTEREWNLAAVVGVDDPRSISDADLLDILKPQFPWGASDDEGAERFGNYNGGTDGHDGTAPVMSFLPNHLGIFDLGGNAWEWCDGWHDTKQEKRVLRGCGYLNHGGYRNSATRVGRDSAYRAPTPPLDDYTRTWIPGFRCVVEAASATSTTPTKIPLLPAWLADARQKGGKLRAFGTGPDGIDELGRAKDLEQVAEVAVTSRGWLARQSDGTSVGVSWGFSQKTNRMAGTPIGPFPVIQIHRGGTLGLLLDNHEYRNVWGGGSQHRPDLVHPDAAAVLNIAGHLMNLDKDGHILVAMRWEKAELRPPEDLFVGANDFVGIGRSYIVAKPGKPVIGWRVIEQQETVFPSEISDVVQMEASDSHLILLTSSGRVHVTTETGAPTENPELAAPPNLPLALAVRTGRGMCAAQVTNGSWVAWGESPELIKQTKEIGVALDLDFDYDTASGSNFMLWVEPTPEMLAAAKSAPPSTASTAPASTPSTPAPSTAITTAPAQPIDDVAARLAQLATQFQEAYDRDILPPHQSAVDDLDQKYLAAITRAMNAATKAAELTEAVQLRDESSRVKSKEPLPATDTATLPKSLLDLRKTYRAALDDLETTRNQNAKPYYDRYDALLEAYQTELTRQRRLDDAVRVKNARTELEKARTQHSSDPPSAAG